MTAGPLVSVIIPVYNGTNYLADAVESVLAQSHDSVELLVIDDGSTDHTWEMIRSFGDRVRGIRKENGGVASAMNRGIEESSGQYIAWLSHDDMFLPEKLERQVRFLAGSTTCRACFTDFEIVDPDGRPLRTVRTPELTRNELRRHLFGRMFINGSSMMIDRRCFDEVGLFREDLRTTQDAEMWIRLLDRWHIGRVGEVLALQRSHPDQGSRDEGPHRAEKEATFAEAFDRLGVAGLFPEWEIDPESPGAAARARVWLGDTVAVHRYWFEFANRQYRAAVRTWPSPNNPARARLLLGARLWTAPSRHTRRLRHRLGRLRARVGPERKNG
jgi:glycosyltransferase involved in cell wall biosynthesis